MKGFYLGVFSLAFFPHSISAAPTSPLDRQSPCHSEFLLEVEINAYGAAGAVNAFHVIPDNYFHDISERELAALH
jgi:hypothetical protein